MSGNRKHIDDIFKDGLSGHEVMPPAEIWEKVSSQISRSKRTRMFYLLVKAAAAVAVLLGSSVTLMYLMSPDGSRDFSLSHETEMFSLPATEISPGRDRQPVIIPAPGPRELPADSRRITENPPVRPESNLTRAAARTLSDTGGLRSDNDGLPVRLMQPLKTGGIGPGYGPAKEEDARPGMRLIAETAELLMEKAKRKKWHAGIMVAPGYSYRTLLNQRDEGLIPMYNSRETGMFSYTGRVTVTYMISDRISVQTGVDLLNMGQTIGGLQVFSNPYAIELLRSNSPDRFSAHFPTFTNSLGEIYTLDSDIHITDNHKKILYDFTGSMPVSSVLDNFQNSGELVQEIYYFQIPLVARYRIFQGNTGVVLSGGLGANVMAGNRVLLKQGGESEMIGRTLGISNFGVSGIAGIGLEQNLGKNMILLLEPRISHFIRSVNPGQDHRHLPYSISFYGGVSFRF
jgi:hypothetical protein